MELPPPGVEPSPEWFAEFQSQPLGERLRLAVEAAERLSRETAAAFPEAAAALGELKLPDDADRVALGDLVSGEILELAMQLDPVTTMNALEPGLAEDKAAEAHTTALFSRLTLNGAPK